MEIKRQNPSFGVVVGRIKTNNPEKLQDLYKIIGSSSNPNAMNAYRIETNAATGKGVFSLRGPAAAEKNLAAKLKEFGAKVRIIKNSQLQKMENLGQRWMLGLKKGEELKQPKLF